VRTTETETKGPRKVKVEMKEQGKNAGKTQCTMKNLFSDQCIFPLQPIFFLTGREDLKQAQAGLEFFIFLPSHLQC
jgi:hypothetical protein